MPIKKSELYSSLWSSCDELRGGMDASQYKDYVLVLLFWHRADGAKRALFSLALRCHGVGCGITDATVNLLLS